MRSPLVVLLASLSPLACLPTMQVGDRTMDKHDTESAFDVVRERAAFEARCPSSQLTLSVLEAYSYQNAKRARQIGVEGCGHRLIYVRVDTTSGMYGSSGTTWVLNSSSSRGADGSSADEGPKVQSVPTAPPPAAGAMTPPLVPPAPAAPPAPPPPPAPVFTPRP
jgi:hypothetical protein